MLKDFQLPHNINDIDSEDKKRLFYWVDQSYERLCKLSEQGNLPDTLNMGIQ